MSPEEREFTRQRLARAQETFEDAKLLIEHGRLHSAVNRLYYAAFHAVSALLFTDGLSSTKHSGVRSLFDRHWIKSKCFPTEMSRFYRSLFNNRQQADYADRIGFSREDVEAWSKETARFIDRISAELEERLRSAS